MNKLIIKKLYTEKNWSLRRISEKFKTDHHTIKRVLVAMDVPIEKKPTKPFTKEHKERISVSCKGRTSWAKGKKMPQESLYKNMAAHLRFDVDYEWLSQFKDVEKLKFLNRCITNRTGRFDVDTAWYKSYVTKFYEDTQFNAIYKKWLGSGDKYLLPTIDHVEPKAKGGLNDIDNIQFLSWFENRSKNDMSQDIWDSMKKNIGDYFV